MDGLVMAVNFVVNAADLLLNVLLLVCCALLKAAELSCQPVYLCFEAGNPAICINIHPLIIPELFQDSLLHIAFHGVHLLGRDACA